MSMVHFKNDPSYSYAGYFEEMMGAVSDFEDGSISAKETVNQMQRVHQHAIECGLPLPEFKFTVKSLKEFSTVIDFDK